MKPNKELQDEWYAKLKAGGFEDIELDERNLKVADAHYFIRRFSETTFNAREEYFQAAGKFLHDHKFRSVIERIIWTRHCEGLSTREIARYLKDTGIKKNKDTVNLIVRRLVKIMFGG